MAREVEQAQPAGRSAADSAGIVGEELRRPRRDSNAQPADSKSVALSIELRGRVGPPDLETKKPDGSPADIIWVSDGI